MSKIKSRIKLDYPVLVKALAKFAANSYASVNDISHLQNCYTVIERDVPEELYSKLSRELTLTPKMYTVIFVNNSTIANIIYYQFTVEDIVPRLPGMSADPSNCIVYMSQFIDNVLSYGQLHFTEPCPELTKHISDARLSVGSQTQAVRDILTEILKREHDATYDNAFEESD